MTARRVRGRDERGFALLAVLLVLALLGVVGAEFAYSMRLEASAVRAWKENIAATHLAEAGIAQAIREIAAEFTYVAFDDQELLTFYKRDLTALPKLPREKVPLGPGQFSYRITDEEARLNINTATPDRLDRLLRNLGLDKQARDIVVDSVQDWRDPNEEHRLNGAESEDYYLKLPVPYRSHNANLDSIAELLQIRGVTPALFDGGDGKLGLVDLVTVKSSGSNINVNTASEAVLRAYGLGDAQISLVTQARRVQLYQSPPTNLGVGISGLRVTSQTFRIEADGLVDGQSHAHIMAVVNRRGDPAGGMAIAVLEWAAR